MVGLEVGLASGLPPLIEGFAEEGFRVFNMLPEGILGAKENLRGLTVGSSVGVYVGSKVVGATETSSVASRVFLVGLACGMRERGALVGIMERVGLFMEPSAGLYVVIGETVGIFVLGAVGVKVMVLVGDFDGKRLGKKLGFTDVGGSEG